MSGFIQTADTYISPSQSASSDGIPKVSIKDVIYRANIIQNVTGILWSIFNAYFGRENAVEPACVIAGIPLPSITELSGAISDAVLKYRATGGVFLAHQDGGYESLRIVGKAWGPNRYMFLNMLQFLFLYGSATTIDYFDNVDEALAPWIGQHEQVVTENPWLTFDRNAIDTGLQESHLTFPIITKIRVYLSMYIETYTYEESVELGKECIKYSIFFRKFDGFTKYEYAKMDHPTKTDQNGKPIPMYFYRDTERKSWLNMAKTMLPLVISVVFRLAILPADPGVRSVAYNFAYEMSNPTQRIPLNPLKFGSFL